MLENTETALFLHECCGSGLKFRNSWALEHPEVKIEEVSFFNVYHRKLHEQWGFEINDLKKGSFIIYQNTLIREINA